MNGPGAVPFLILRSARMVESRLIWYCWVLLFVGLFLVVRAFCCVYWGYCFSDAVDGNGMRGGYMFAISSAILSVIVTVGMQDCMRWLATP